MSEMKRRSGGGVLVLIAASLFLTLAAVPSAQAQPATTQPAATQPSDPPALSPTVAEPAIEMEAAAAAGPDRVPVVQPWDPQFPSEAEPVAAVDEPPAPPTPRDSLSSPQATMFTFLEAMNEVQRGRDEHLPVALQTMDLSQVDPREGPRLAERLMAILDRLGEVRRGELPDIGAVESENISRFRYFPREREHARVLRKLETMPEGRIVLEKGDDGAWRFSADTVSEINGLYESLKALPPLYVKPSNEMMEMLGPTFDRTPLWGWAALLGLIFIGVAGGKVLQSMLRGTAERFERNNRRVGSTVLGDAIGPVGLAVITLGLTAGLRFIYIEDRVMDFLHAVLQFLYLIAVGWFLFNLVDVLDLAMRRLADRTDSRLDNMVVPLIRKSLRIFLVVVFTLVVAQNVFGLNITGWLAGLGIAGLAVSLAAQDSIKNLFGSITVFFDKPFAVGDRIKFDAYDGPVEEIGFRSTKIRTLEGHLVTIPNMKFIDSNVENVGVRPSIRRLLDVTITYDTPPEKIEEAVGIIRSILAEPEIVEPFDLEKLPPRCAFNDFNAASLNIRVLYWYMLVQGRDYWSYLDHAQKFNLRLFRAFAAAGIDFAFPTQTIHLAGDPKRELALRLEGGREAEALPAGAGDGRNGGHANGR